jgi:hypothetical protein
MEARAISNFGYHGKMIYSNLLFIVAGQWRFAVQFSPKKHKSIGGRFNAKIELMIIVIYLAENTDIAKVLL